MRRFTPGWRWDLAGLEPVLRQPEFKLIEFHDADAFAVLLKRPGHAKATATENASCRAGRR